MVRGIVAARTILLMTICLLLASSPAFSQRYCPLPSARVLSLWEAAEVQKETEAALHADYDKKAAILSKYIRASEDTAHPAFEYVFCRLVLDDTNTGMVEKLRLVSLVTREEARRGLPPGSPPSACPPLRPTRGMNDKQIADVHRETEEALHADYSAKSAIILKYLGRSGTSHPAVDYVFCKIVIEDKGTSRFTRIRLAVLFFIGVVRNEFWPASTSGR
jgi:hypothetical protein